MTASTFLTCSSFFCSSGVRSCSLSSSVASSPIVLAEGPLFSIAAFPQAGAAVAEAEGAGAATWTLDIFCAIAVPTLGCKVGISGFEPVTLPASPACGNAAGWFFLLSQSGVGSLAIDGGIAPSAWLSPLSMPSYLSAWESVMMSSSWLAIAAIAAPTCCEETDILVWGGEGSGKQTAIRKCAGT